MRDNQISLKNMSELSKSQKKAFEAYRDGKDLFVHGDAGTGKSFLVDRIVKDAIVGHKNVIVVAPTGKAARNVKGTTIHSTFRAPIGVIGPEDIFKGRKDKDDQLLLDLTDLIIVDEISMVRYDLFAGVLRSISAAEKRSNRHKQIIVVGDFFQLPPVLTEKDENVYREHYGDNLFAFQGGLMNSFISAKLTEKMRQKDDARFAGILDRLREGDTDALDLLPVSKANKKAVTLCAKNKEADSINSRMLDKLKNHHVYTGEIVGRVTDEDMFAPKLLEIAPGARVLMTVNDADKRWINGTEAEVEECLDGRVIISIGDASFSCEPVTQVITETEIVEERDSNGNKKLKSVQKEIGKYTQLPFKLGWAISIHKSQGMTLEEVNIDPSGCFAHGQLYVAISRCKTLDGIHLTTTPLTEHLICSQVVKDFMHGLPDYGPVGTFGPRQNSSPSLGQDIYPANKPAGQKASQHTEAEVKRETLPTLPAKRPAGIKDIERKTREYGIGLLRQEGHDGYVVEVRIITDRTGVPKSIDPADDRARKDAKKARMSAAMEKLMTVDDAGIRQQLALLSLDAQEVYHELRGRATNGNVAVTTDEIAGIDGISISKRSIENALQELRNAGLTSSIGPKKTPVIHLTESLIPINAAECLLYKAAHSPREISRMQSICSQCTQSCPVHPLID